jgi:hypothetical protein
MLRPRTGALRGRPCLGDAKPNVKAGFPLPGRALWTLLHSIIVLNKSAGKIE